MNIVSSESTRKYLKTIDNYFLWLRCGYKHRTLANNKSWDFYRCPKCMKPNYYSRPYRIFVLCA